MSKKRRRTFDDMTPNEQRMLIHCKMAENMDEAPWWLSILVAAILIVVLPLGIHTWFTSVIANMPDPSSDCVLSEVKCADKSELVARRLKFMAEQGPFRKQ